MGDPIPLPHDAQLRTFPPATYKSKRYQATYCCVHCCETLSGRPVAYSLWLPWTIPIPARANGDVFFHFCSEEHARTWLDDQTRPWEMERQRKREEQEARDRERAARWTKKVCIGCNQKFSVNEHGHLVIPFVPPTTCDRCGKPLCIEYHEDWVSYSCQGHIGGTSTLWRGFSSTYCPTCREKQRIERSAPCCVCQQKKLAMMNDYRGYSLVKDGTCIHLCCSDCETAFLALPESRQAFYIRTRCNLAFASGQVIYSLVDPESPLVYRYVGRTHDRKKRLQQHLKDHREEPTLVGIEGRPYYSRANWVHDLYLKGLRPTMQTLREVEIAPQTIEWERRYILHGIQQGWPLVNMEIAAEGLVTRAKASKLDFLHCSFESLVQERFVSEHGIEAFVRAFYR